MESNGRRVRVLVTLGTDVHPFDRLVSWTERLIQEVPALDVTVQHGTTRSAAGADNVAMMDGGEFSEALAHSDLVISQGGPGGIFEARSAGRLPLVVPRRQELGEHVDNHQVIFTSMLAEQRIIRLAEGEDDFLSQAVQMIESGAAILPSRAQRTPDGVSAYLDILQRPASPLPMRTRLRRAWSSLRPQAPNLEDGFSAGRAPQ